ncbi:hypothetical protein F5Y06DRAFT_256485 [Hypoxylon sp. FL0890]|nr:hypothetical protein F5Y06DRAFT_256485 [Hypoxylon sp. FL0890]
MADQPEDIEPRHINWAANRSRRYRTRDCYCGWYHFYGICGHYTHRHPLKCGDKRTRSGMSGFCTIPAPQYNVTDYRVNALCNHCLGNP